jgi:hypothetical protein
VRPALAAVVEAEPADPARGVPPARPGTYYSSRDAGRRQAAEDAQVAISDRTGHLIAP